MKVICVDNNNVLLDNKWNDITIGKEYTCVDINKIYYKMIFSEHFCNIHCFILDDSKIYCIYPKNLFISLEEYRNKRLEEIGI